MQEIMGCFFSNFVSCDRNANHLRPKITYILAKGQFIKTSFNRVKILIWFSNSKAAERLHTEKLVIFLVFQIVIAGFTLEVFLQVFMTFQLIFVRTFMVVKEIWYAHWITFRANNILGELCFPPLASTFNPFAISPFTSLFPLLPSFKIVAWKDAILQTRVSFPESFKVWFI